VRAQAPANQTTVVASQDIAPKIDEYMNAMVKAGSFNGSILIARGQSDREQKLRHVQL